MTSDVNGRLIGLGFAVLLLPIIYVFHQHGEQNRGLVVYCVAGVFATIVYVKRRDLMEPLLLLPIVVLFAVELSTAFLVPLPSKIPGFIMIPISIADCVLLLWLLDLIDKSLVRLRRGKSAGRHTSA